MTTDQLRQLDRQYVWHPFTPMKLWAESDPLVIVAAEGMHLIDSDGNRYLDGVSSLWCNVHGHRVREIDDAIRAQLDKIAHSTMLGLASEPATILAERLMKIVPRGLARIFYSDSGATATEVAFKLAAQYWYNVGRPEKCEFVGFAEAYHGDTFGAMSVGRTPAFHKPYFPLLFKVHFAPTPFEYRYTATSSPLPPGEGRAKGAALGEGEGMWQAVWSAGQTTPTSDAPSPAPLAHAQGLPSPGGRGKEMAVRDHALAALERVLLEHGTRIAAVCIEPIVQGAAGMIVHPPGFLRGVRDLCTKYDVLLIADEVAVGFGRTGRMFACEHEDVRPDLMCVAKGLTGGYLPLAATFATQRIFDAFLGEPWEGKTFYHGHTYTGNPLAAAAAIASLDLFEKNGLVRKVQEKSAVLAEMLKEVAALPHVGEVRQKGFMIGIELVEDRETKRPFDPKRRVGAEVCTQIRRHGVILRPLGDVIVLMPPLATEAEDLRQVVDAVQAEVSRLG